MPSPLENLPQDCCNEYAYGEYLWIINEAKALRGQYEKVGLCGKNHCSVGSDSWNACSEAFKIFVEANPEAAAQVLACRAQISRLVDEGILSKL